MLKNNDPNPIEGDALVGAQLAPRLTREALWMRVAELVAQRGTCDRLRVGAVITDSEMRRVIAIGYNGQPRGMPHVCRTMEPGNCGCVHAELNALLGADTRDAYELFVTTAPCERCAAAIINATIHRVWYRTPYRDERGAALLVGAGIALRRLP